MPAIKKTPQQPPDWCLKTCIFTKGQISPTIFFQRTVLGYSISSVSFTKWTGLMKNRDVFFFFSSYLLRPFGRENCHSTQSKELQPAMPAPRSAWFHSVRSLRHWIQDVRAGLLENSPRKSAQLKPLPPWYAVTDVLVGRDLWWALAQTLA